MAKKTSGYRDSLLDDLRDPVEAAAYINAAIEESPDMLLIALRNVAESRSMAQTAKCAGVAREAVYRMLSASGNPRLKSLRGILQSCGLDFLVTPMHVHKNVMPKTQPEIPLRRIVRRSKGALVTSGQLNIDFDRQVVSNASTSTRATYMYVRESIYDGTISIEPHMIPTGNQIEVTHV